MVLETPDGLRSFTCGEEEHIWNAAEASGVTLPAICHQGRCLTCAGLLLEGAIDHDRPDMYFAEDKVAGYVLLCRAMPRSDVRILTHQGEEMRAYRHANGLPAPYA
ncbi:MAG: 2Fe-2S iron-sulfur cluster-binding protein [Acidobacteriaceae bacterium]